MKHLTVIRHAEAAPLRSLLADFDRILTDHGTSDARKSALRMAELFPHADLLLSSPAKRALSTALIFAEALGIPPDTVRTDPLIYSGSSEDLLNIIRNWDNSLEEVILVGHNPAVADLVIRLYPQYLYRFPPCFVCRLDFKTDFWMELDATPPVLRYHAEPERQGNHFPL